VAGKLALYLTMREQKITNSASPRSPRNRSAPDARPGSCKSEKLQAALSALEHASWTRWTMSAKSLTAR
jgi:hypothetical protein